MMGIMRVSFWLVLLLILSGCGHPLASNGRAVFRAVIADPIPAAVSGIASTGYITDAGHNIYLRFTIVDTAYLPELLALYAYQPVDCESMQVQGRLTLPQGLNIPGWRPFNGTGYQCYASEVGYRNRWTQHGNSVILVRQQPMTVFFNETG